MPLKELSLAKVKTMLKRNGLCLETPPFNINIKTESRRVAEQFKEIYADYRVIQPSSPINFNVLIKHQRKWFKPQAQFYFDNHSPFLPLPANQDFAMFEWGLNWCYANHAHQYLILHAAVLSKQNKGLILPGFPGAGKSTLSAELMLNNWQLYSDELCFINKDRQLQSAPRPVSLKNQSIDIIKKRHKNAILTEAAIDTAKGSVSHLKLLPNNITSSQCSAFAIIFPKYQADSELIIEPLDKAEALVFLAEQGFNYHILGLDGFQRLEDVVSSCQCFQLTYSSLDDACKWLNNLFKNADD